MGTVTNVFTWNRIDPGETVGLFLHGYAMTEFVAFNIVLGLASNQPSGAYTSIAAQLTEGPTNAFDGIAHTITVQNQTIGPQPYIYVELLDFTQDIDI